MGRKEITPIAVHFYGSKCNIYTLIELLVDDPMSNFYDGLKSESTRKQYPTRLKYFFDSLHTKENDIFVPLSMDIKDQITEFMSHKSDPEYIEKCFRKMLHVQRKRVQNKEIEESTIFNYYKAAKVFCDQNAINTNWKRITNIIPKGRKHATDRIPSEEEIDKLVSYPDKRMKPIVYTMLSCGMRIEAWDYLRWKHITPFYDQNENVIAAKILIYAGDKEQYYSFITPEAYNYLKNYIDYRQNHGEKISGESWLLRDTFVSTLRNANNLGINDRPKKLTSGGVKSLLERAAISQNLFIPLEKGQKRREWKLAHGLRKYFKTKTEQKMKSIHIEMLMGHDLGVTNSYYKPTDQDILKDYLHAVDLLTFDFANKKISEIEERISKGLSSQVESLQKEILKLKKNQSSSEFNRILKIIKQQEKEKIENLMIELKNKKIKFRLTPKTFSFSFDKVLELSEIDPDLDESMDSFKMLKESYEEYLTDPVELGYPEIELENKHLKLLDKKSKKFVIKKTKH